MIRRIVGLASAYRERSSIVDVNQHGVALSDVQEITHHEHGCQAIPQVSIALYQALQRLLHDVLLHVILRASAHSLDEMMDRV